MRAWIFAVMAALGALSAGPTYAASTTDAGPATFTNPDWLQKPNFQQMLLAWPRGSAFKGVSGRAILKCTVNKQGFLQDCSVLSETPADHGFGQAALKLTPTLLFKPALRNGEPVDSEVTIPITFATENDFRLPNAVIVDTPYWSKTPNVSEILSQLDKKVGDKFADGKVVFMCDLNKVTGKLTYCTVVNQSHGMAQFNGVGKTLSNSFQADPATLASLRASLDPTQTEALVFLPFSFPDMTSPAWQGRHLTHVQWTRLLGPTPGRPLFPEAAAKAGLKAGSASVDCLIADNGGLSDCKVIKESAPNLGFGDMAKTIAEASAINPWTDEGLPAGGARVQLPIQMTYDEKLAASTPAKP
jgi:TonB family protein